ncbi:OLC1v1037843C1 [Oldenlandia corymbosa var. corymbosa]|nr:OLC1v1037843C1 [Oldenlandia corymbosa var. corymbosa]
MESEKGVEIAIPILEASKRSDAGKQEGGNLPKYSSGRANESGAYCVSNAVQGKTSNGNSVNADQTLRRRHGSSKFTETDSSLISELQIRSLSMKTSKFTQTKSRVLDVEQSDPTSLNAVFESNEMKNTGFHARGSLSQKIKSMRAGTLAPSEGKGDDYGEGSDHKDDEEDDDEKEEEEEYGEKKGDEKKGKRRRFSKISKKLKAMDVVIEWLLFTGAMVVLIASLYADDLKFRAIWGLEIWKWCVLVAVIFCGRLVTKWAKDAIVFLIESKFLFNERVVYFLHGVKQSVRVAIWLALVLGAWVLLIDRDTIKRSKETVKVLSYITKALVASLIGAVMWMVKTLLVKFIAASFHVKTFFAKIREAISDEYVLWTLSVPPSLNLEEDGSNNQAKNQCFGFKLAKWLRWGSKKECTGVDDQQKVLQKKSSQVQQEGKITLRKLGKMKPGKMPASTMGQLIDRIKSSKLSIVSSALYDDHLDDGGEQKDITSRKEAEAAASLIFQNVRRRGRDYIKKGDLLPFMNKENGDCLVEWFEKVAEEEKITETNLSEWAVNTFRQREYLSHSLKDAKTAIEELNRILSGIVLVLIIVVWLLLMGFATTKVIFLMSSQILLAGFVFRNACKTVFEALIFVFVMHPFDVGDRCVIDGVMMVVEEMDILKTAFLRYDNEMIYYPNAVLATKAISNFNRSPQKMGDTVNFDIDIWTPAESIETLKAKIKE